MCSGSWTVTARAPRPERGMAFPEHLSRILDTHGVRPDTKAALYDLYVSLGDEVLDVFSDLAEGVASPAMLTPEDTVPIRAWVVEQYLRRNHPHWREGKPTASLWHPRELEGRASGLALPLGVLPPASTGGGETLVHRIETAARTLLGETQPLPEGLLLLGRNAHYGGRQETISFDIVPAKLDDAVAVALAAGQQHTLPGSVGATSGTHDGARGVALIWEVQPNVYKPAGERNRSISRIYRRHRNWHLATLIAALEWLRDQQCQVYILRGERLAVAHEVNPGKPLSETIVAHHNRTVADVAGTLDRPLVEATDDDGFRLLDSVVMNHALRRHVLQYGAAGSFWRL
jgi:hypothetical protein